MDKGGGRTIARLRNTLWIIAFLLCFTGVAAAQVTAENGTTFSLDGHDSNIEFGHSNQFEEIEVTDTTLHLDNVTVEINSTGSPEITTILHEYERAVGDGDTAIELTTEAGDHGTVDYRFADIDLPGDTVLTLEGDSEFEETFTAGEDVVWSYSDFDGDRTFTLTVEDEDAPEPAPAYFAVTITETNDPVVEGEPLEVTATVENTGDKTDSQTVTLEIDDEEVDAASMTLGGGMSMTETFTYDTVVGDAGDRAATVASADESDSTNVTVTEADDDDPVVGAPGSGVDELVNITVSSDVKQLPADGSATGTVTAENPSDQNLTITVAAKHSDASCDYITLEDENLWGESTYDLPPESATSIGYEVDLTDAPGLEPGDTITCEYAVTGSGVEETEFAITAEIVEDTVVPTGFITANPAVALIGVLIVVVLIVFWPRRR